MVAIVGSFAERQVRRKTQVAPSGHKLVDGSDLVQKLLHTQVDHVVGAIESFSVDNWVILVAVSAVGIVGYLCYTASLKSVTPTSVSVLRSQEIVLAYFCQVQSLI